MESRDTTLQAPFKKATLALMKGRYKLMYFFGYPELRGNERVELYDIESDPEELNELSAAQPDLAHELLSKLKSKLSEVNQPYL